jgi:hypothetical protein
MYQPGADAFSSRQNVGGKRPPQGALSTLADKEERSTSGVKKSLQAEFAFTTPQSIFEFK